MNFNFFSQKKEIESSKVDEEFDESGFTKSELDTYDKSVKFYYTNIINSLILFTYNAKQLDDMSPILIDPLTELYQEIEYAFTPVCFETVFRNNFIDEKFKDELLNFFDKVKEVPNEIWDWEFLDNHHTWKDLRSDAEKILTDLGITHRLYSDDYDTIISKYGVIIKQGKKGNE